MQALEKTPADRFQTMEEFAERAGRGGGRGGDRADGAAAGVDGGAAGAGARSRRSGAGRRTGSQEVPRPLERADTSELAGARVPRRRVRFWSHGGRVLVLLAAVGFGVMAALAPRRPATAATAAAEAGSTRTRSP